MELNLFADIAKFCPKLPPKSPRLSISITSPLDWKFAWSVDWKVVGVILAALTVLSFLIGNVPLVSELMFGVDVLFFIWLGQFRSRSTGPNNLVRSPEVRRFRRGGGSFSVSRGYDESYSPGIMGGAGPFPVGKRRKRQRRDTYRG